MSKFEQVLSDEEVDNIVKNTTMLLGQSIARSKDFILKVEQAVLAKLVEQEPVAWASSKIVGHYIPHDTKVTAADWFKDGLDVPLYTHPMPCVSTTSDKTACVSESKESEDQDIEPLKQALETMIRAAHPAHVTDDFLRNTLIKARDVAFKALENHRLNAKERHRTTKNNIPDIGQMVPKGWFCAKERLPEIVEYYEGSVAGMSDTVLTYTIDEEDPDGGRFCAQWLRKGGQGDLTTLYWNGEDDKPDYWMPLPAAPKYTG